MPYNMEKSGLRSSPGQGFGKRPTTTNMEIGLSYGKRKPTKEETFEAVGGYRGGPVALDHVTGGENYYPNAKPTSSLDRNKVAAAKAASAYAGAQPWEKPKAEGLSYWQRIARTLPEMQALREEHLKPPEDVYIPPWEMTLTEIYGKDARPGPGLW